jgi:ubiquinone/menaquinone biosynthesis C-methylase UbiE/uncharacterized membrane protein YphA (DoxX/SURF4 family)
MGRRMRGRVAAVWSVRLLLAALFLGAGATKLAAPPEAVAGFERLGLGAAGRVAIGLLEIAGALGLLVSPLAALAALGLAAIMVGAIAAHLTVLGPSALPAAVVLALCLLVAWAERGTLGLLRLLSTGKGPMDGWVARAYDRGVQAAFREILPTLADDLLPRLEGVGRLLDVGCGPGRITVFVAESAPDVEVVGTDLAPTMIELARGHAARSPAAGRLRFEVADVQRLPFADGSFDAVISTGSIKQWPDAVAGLREIHRVLRPGGRALIAEMNRRASPEAIAAQRDRLRHWFFRWIYPHVFTHALAPDEARRAFEASPFGGVREQRLLLDGCIWVIEAARV